MFYTLLRYHLFLNLKRGCIIYSLFCFNTLNRINLIFLLCLFSLVDFSQADSVMILVNKQTVNENKIDILLNSITNTISQKKVIEYSRLAYSLSVLEDSEIKIAKSSVILANCFFKKDNYDSAIYFINIGIKQFKTSDNKIGLFDALTYKFYILNSVNKSNEAFEINKQLINLSEKMNNEVYKAKANLYMADFFYGIKDYQKSIDYAQNALKLYLKTNNSLGIQDCYLKLGNSNNRLNLTDIAIEYFERGYKLSKQTKEFENGKLFLSGIAAVYYRLGNNEKAFEYYKKALGIIIGNNDNNIDLKNNIGSVLMGLERYNEAKPYLIEAYFESRNSNTNKDLMIISSFNLAEVYEQLGDYKTAMDYIDIYINLNDSVNNIQNLKNLSEVEAKYQNEKKEEQNIVLGERLKNKSLQMYFALAGILLLSGMVFFVIRGLKQKNKANLKLEEKNKIIEEKSIIVEQQHKDITDSIKYAERIQQAILPPEQLWKRVLPKSFLFYQPKDILSGDFYWIEETEDYIFVAAADCTGHGVPGALMSIVNYNLLNRAVLEKGLTTAGEILDGVNTWLTQSLHQSYQESAVRDGMDLSLCVINKKTKQLNFAGAFNSIYILRNNDIEELIPDKQPVGAYIEDNIKPFTDSFYDLTDNDVVYMFTDGYADQFGGPKGKKFKYKNLKTLLLEIYQLPFDKQKEIAVAKINDWKGNLEQIDDILLIGFKIC
jgi:serine phosphatase RsbU (regulator of sigma subunit)